MCDEFQGKRIGGFTKVWVRVKLQYFEDEFYVYAYKYSKKIWKRKINFDELPKKNSRIKITKIKNMRIDTKALNFNL